MRKTISRFDSFSRVETIVASTRTARSSAGRGWTFRDIPRRTIRMIRAQSLLTGEAPWLVIYNAVESYVDSKIKEAIDKGF